MIFFFFFELGKDLVDVTIYLVKYDNIAFYESYYRYFCVSI